MALDRNLPNLKLPSAPPSYDREDQSQTRRLIEQHWHPQKTTAAASTDQVLPLITLTLVLDTSNIPNATAEGNSVVTRVKFAGRTDRYPTADEVRAEASVSPAPYTASYAPLASGATEYVAAFGYDAAWNESPLELAQVTAEGTTGAIPWWFLRRGQGYWQDAGKTTAANVDDRVYTWEDQMGSGYDAISNFTYGTGDDMRPLRDATDQLRFGTGPGANGHTGFLIRDTISLNTIEVLVGVRAFADPGDANRDRIYEISDGPVTYYTDATGHIQDGLGAITVDAGAPGNLDAAFNVFDSNASNLTHVKTVRLNQTILATYTVDPLVTFVFGHAVWSGAVGYRGLLGTDNGGQCFDGWIRDFVVFDRILTEPERADWYQYLSGATDVAPIDGVDTSNVTLTATHSGGDVIVTASSRFATSAKIDASLTATPSDAAVRATTEILPPRPFTKTFPAPTGTDVLHVKAFVYFATLGGTESSAVTLDVTALGGSFGGTDNGDGTITVPIVIVDDSGNITGVTQTTFAVGGLVPSRLLAAETFTVPANKQALFKLPIRVQGHLIVRGDLLQVG